MKPKKTQKKLRITEADFMLANRKAIHQSRKVYDRKRLKRVELNLSDKLE